MNWRDDFPLLHNLSTEEQPYVYLDSAATTLKPQKVIDAVTNYYQYCGANVHRGNYRESEQATLLYENTRSSIAHLINAKKHEIIFTRGTTDSINLLADLLEITPEDKIINCLHEHHANFIPWNERGQLFTVGLTPKGLIDLEELEAILA